MEKDELPEDLFDEIERENAALVYGVQSPILLHIREVQARLQKTLNEAGMLSPPDEQSSDQQIPPLA